MKVPVVVVLEDIRSLHNVGSIFRTVEGAGIEKLVITGISGYPTYTGDSRKPWEQEQVTEKIHKTALGAEKLVDWEYEPTIEAALKKLKEEGYTLLAAELHNESRNLYETEVHFPLAVVVGNEVDGVSKEVMAMVDYCVYIPMQGKKESLNVANSVSVIVYELVRRYLWR